MKTTLSLTLSLIFGFTNLLLAAKYQTVSVPAYLDHAAFDRLLELYVDETGLVDYAGWKEYKEDLEALDEYIAQFAPTPEPKASGDDAAASLINLYNAITLQWILKNYPTESIRELDDSWTSRRHLAGGEKVSLDDIEHGTLRPLIGWKVHAVVVCAARSCPPLQAFAYEGEKLSEQIDQVYRTWLSRPDLNRFLPDDKRVEISKIFDWYGKDFIEPGGVKPILLKYAPEDYQEFLKDEKYKIKFQEYHWGLNDQTDLGKDYEFSIIKSFF